MVLTVFKSINRDGYVVRVTDLTVSHYEFMILQVYLSLEVDLEYHKFKGFSLES